MNVSRETHVKNLVALAHSIRCSNCGKAREGFGRYCRTCHAAYMRAWRRRRPSGLPVEDSQKLTARATAGTYYFRHSYLKRPCERCGAPKTEMHHPDYSKPLEVVFLCHPCHLREHGKQPRSTQFGQLLRRWNSASEETRAEFLRFLHPESNRVTASNTFNGE
jgi:hypothetical protein